MRGERIDFEGIDVTRENDLSVAEIKECAIFAHLTDEQALEVIETIKKIANIAFECCPKTPKSFEKSAIFRKLGDNN